MQALSLDLIRSWGRGTVILSPRDLMPERIGAFADKVVKAGGTCLLDPQLFDPHANWPNLTRHQYWPQAFTTNVLTDPDSLDVLMCSLRALNDECQTEAFIIPSVRCAKADSAWLDFNDLFLSSAGRMVSNKPSYATLCLAPEVVGSRAQIDHLLTEVESWDVDGFYVVPEHPRGDYLVDDAYWLANLLKLCGGLRMNGRKVMVGYASHQLLCLASAKVDAIASGNFINVRSFSVNKFSSNEDETKNRATWYYCPQALSEYRLDSLDLAYGTGLLDRLKPDPTFDSGFASILFSGAQPTSTAFSEGDAYAHYLSCLYQQVRQVCGSSYSSTFAGLFGMLDEAQSLLDQLHRAGIRGRHRDFAECLNATRDALTSFDHESGYVMARRW